MRIQALLPYFRVGDRTAARAGGAGRAAKGRGTQRVSAFRGISVRRNCRASFIARTRASVRVCIWALAAATALAQPSAPELRKGPPDSGSRGYDKRLTALIEQRYPGLHAGKPEGIPVVTVLLNYDGSVAGTYLEFAREGAAALTASEEKFARFGLSAGRMQYIGVGRIQLSTTPAVVIIGAGDSRDLDRALVERFFPNALTQRAPANHRLWILFDHEGRVLRTGEETTSPEKLRQALEARFPGIRTTDMTSSPVFGRNNLPLEDSSHHPLELDCVWLAAGSALPNLKSSN